MPMEFLEQEKSNPQLMAGSFFVCNMVPWFIFTNPKNEEVQIGMGKSKIHLNTWTYGETLWNRSEQIAERC